MNERLQTGKAILGYLKKNCPNYKEEYIRVGAKQKWAGSPIYLIQNGQFIDEYVYAEKDCVDCLIPRLIDYFDGKPWDASVYYQECGRIHPYAIIEGGVIVKFKNMAAYHKNRFRLGQQMHGSPFKEIPRCDIFVPAEAYIVGYEQL